MRRDRPERILMRDVEYDHNNFYVKYSVEAVLLSGGFIQRIQKKYSRGNSMNSL